MSDRALSPQELEYMMKEMLVALRSGVNREGTMVVEPSLRYGKMTDNSMTLCTHDFSDPTTWYQQSTRHSAEALTPVDDRVTFKTSHNPVIDWNSPRLYAKDLAMLESDGSFVDRNKYRCLVMIDGLEILPTDANHPWTINYMTGEVRFATRVSNEHDVTADYYAVNMNGGSRFILRPPPGKQLVVEHVEVQFSQSTCINDDIVFEVWGGSPDQRMYMMPMFVNSPMNPWRQVYRCAHDFINNANEGQGFIAPFGGNSWRGLKSNTIVFPFNYIQAFAVQSSLNSEFHVHLAGDTPYTNCEIATCSFYTMIADET